MEKGQKKSRFSILTNNLSLKIISLGLAFIAWFLVAQIGDPRDTKVYSNIPVKLINTRLLEQENKVYEVLDDTDVVRVTVTAPRSVMDNLRPSDIVAEADISKLTDINTVAINYRIANVQDNETSVDGDHDTLRLSVEEKATRWARVKYETVGEVAEGYVITSAIPDQTQIQISGPKSVIDRVHYAYVKMDVEGESSTVSANLAIDLYDKENHIIDQSRIVKNVDAIHMSVEILATKEVPVDIATKGVPAEGYLTTGVIEKSFDKVQIAGSAGAIGGITRIAIPAENIDLTDATENVVRNIDLKNCIPDYIKLVDSTNNGKLTVTVYIEPVAGRTIDLNHSNFTLTDIPEGYKAHITEVDDSYKITISGLAEKINSVLPSSVRGYVNVAAYMEEKGIEELRNGTYEMPVTFAFENGISVDSPIQVKVTVEFVAEE